MKYRDVVIFKVTMCATGILFAMSSPSVAASANEITFAVVGPMTGPLATIGDEMKQGAEAAAAKINAKGGVLGRQIKLSIEDDACDPKQAVSVANLVVGNGVKFVDGHACSGSSIPASEVYGENGVLMMSPASSNPVLTDAAFSKGWTTIMRDYPRDDAQGAFVGPWIAKQYKGQRVVIIDDRSAYGHGLAEAVKAKMNEAGLKEVSNFGINPGEKDYSAVVTKLRMLNPALVYFGGYLPEAALMLRQSADVGFKLHLMVGDSIAAPEFWTVAGGSPGEGTLFTFPSDPKSRPSAAAAVEAIKKAGGLPDGFTLFSYAVIECFAAGIERAGSDDPKKVAAALKNGHAIDTAIGPITFDEKGDVKNATYDINVWHEGKYSKME